MHGLTSATSLWTVASIGTVSVLGYPLLALLLGGLVLLIPPWKELPVLSHIRHGKGLAQVPQGADTRLR